MFIRSYLRASTQEQDAKRAEADLEQFAAERGVKIAARYVENESGAKLARPELFRLINDAHKGDVLLVEQVDRLSRLNAADWDELKAKLNEKRIRVVSLDLPSSWGALKASASDDATQAMLDAVNRMLLDMLAIVARKDYEDRRRRQAQGIEKAKKEGRFKGRPVDAVLHKKINELLDAGFSWNRIVEHTKASRSTILKVSKEREAAKQAA
jgi:DNA invertase Pin-like site-specific DNA recombinase